VIRPQIGVTNSFVAFLGRSAAVSGNARPLLPVHRGARGGGGSAGAERVVRNGRYSGHRTATKRNASRARARGACPFLTDRTTTSLLRDGDRAFDLVADERKPGRVRANNSRSPSASPEPSFAHVRLVSFVGERAGSRTRTARSGFPYKFFAACCLLGGRAGWRVSIRANGKRWAERVRLVQCCSFIGRVWVLRPSHSGCHC
jgi:hypothetical protein